MEITPVKKGDVNTFVTPGNLHESWRTITYGRLAKTQPNDDLWFVCIPGQPNWGMGERFDVTIHRTWTYFVNGEFATQHYFSTFHTDHRQWRSIAKSAHQGEFDHMHETTFREAPIYRHSLEDGLVVNYGYCRFQSETHPDHELWYLGIFPGYAVIVDKACTEPAFIERMWSGKFRYDYKTKQPPHEKWQRWVGISWCHLISTGIGENGEWYRVNNVDWRLNPPHPNMPPNILEIFEQDDRIAQREKQLINRIGNLFLRGQTKR
jgi:hypothetical protein